VDIALLIKAAIMGIVEGLTEFLPISSTGHLILAGALLGFDDARAKVFDLAIQTGAMVAVIWVYRERFQRLAQGQAWEFLGRIPAAIRHPGQRRALFQDPSWQFVRHLAIAFMPAAILGLAFGGWIKAFLFAPIPVAIVLILGGVVILLVERWVAIRPQHVRVREVDQMTNRDALRLGIAQAFALIPGTSRSGATIIGGMIFGLSRKSATEFSFFLAVPLLFFGFQALWIILTPFALFYKDRIEFKNNIFTNKVFYLIDIKEVVFAKNGSLKITYHDGDIELIGMMGIRSTHKSILLNQLQKEIETNRN